MTTPCSTSSRHRPGAQARAADPLRIAGALPRAPAARSSRRCPGSPASSRATSTASFTGRGDARDRARWRRGQRERCDPAENVELCVITGYSGAGKSEAIAAFEDSGYFCVDNLPPRMIGALGELFRLEGSNVRRAAVVTDVRGGEYFDELLAVLEELKAERPRPEGALPRGRRADAARPLQGDQAPASAVARGADRRRHPRRARGPRPAARARRHGHRHDRPDRGDAAAADRGRDARRGLQRAPGADPADVRVQARAAARRGHGARRALSAQPPLPRATCGR